MTCFLGWGKSRSPHAPRPCARYSCNRNPGRTSACVSASSVADRVTQCHRHAQRRGFFETQPHVLEREAGRESEIETARQHMFRELVGRRRVAPARGIEHVEHQLRIEAGLHSQRERLGGDRDGGLRHEIVGELERLPEPRLLADEEHAAEVREQRLDFVERRTRARNHDRECSGARAGDTATHRRIERADAAFAQCPIDRDRRGRAGSREVDEGANCAAVADSIRAAHDVEHDRGVGRLASTTRAADATAAGEPPAPRRRSAAPGPHCRWSRKR